MELHIPDHIQHKLPYASAFRQNSAFLLPPILENIKNYVSFLKKMLPAYKSLP
jgi:hypothetical protein